jgi:hypothetical protein
VDGDGLISRADFRLIFKAYFHLSMDLVRDVVKVMEEVYRLIQGNDGGI